MGLQEYLDKRREAGFREVCGFNRERNRQVIRGFEALHLSVPKVPVVRNQVLPSPQASEDMKIAAHLLKLKVGHKFKSEIVLLLHLKQTVFKNFCRHQNYLLKVITAEKANACTYRVRCIRKYTKNYMSSQLQRTTDDLRMLSQFRHESRHNLVR